MNKYNYEVRFKYNEKAETAFKAGIVPMIQSALHKLTINEFDWFHHEGHSHVNFEVVFATMPDRQHFDKAITNMLRAQKLVARKVKGSVSVVEDGDK